jgi:hypothetical protein
VGAGSTAGIVVVGVPRRRSPPRSRDERIVNNGKTRSSQRRQQALKARLGRPAHAPDLTAADHGDVAAITVPARRRVAVPFAGQAFLVTAAPMLLGVLAAVGGLPVEGAVVGTGLGVWLSTPHVATTLAFYADPAMRPVLAAERRNLIVVPFVLVAAGAAAAMVAPTRVLALGLAGMAMWQIHHFTRQNFGLFAFACRSLGRPGPSDADRRLVYRTSTAGMLGLYSLLRPFGFGLPFSRVAFFAGFAALAWSCGELVRHVSRGRLEPWRIAALTTAVVFYAPLYLFHAHPTAAVIGYGAAHGAQYYLMMFHVTGGRPRRQQARLAVLLPLFAATVGYALLRGGGVGTDSPWRFMIGVAQGAAAAHFVIDATVWKLRQPAQRAYMTDRFAFLAPR